MKEAFRKIAAMMHQAEPEAHFAFEFGDGERLCYGGSIHSPDVTLRFKSPEACRRIIADGFLGFGEAYMDGDIELDGDLPELLRLGMRIGFDQRSPSPWQRILFWAYRVFARNNRSHASQNVSHHYDRGEDFYSLYLDPTMTYSCAYFRNPDDSLERAQVQKYDHIARKLLLKPGETLLDIGCGWGGMLFHAAGNYGVSALGNTVSMPQYDYIQEKRKELGLENKIRVILEDYRNLDGKFDKVVSIGMFEHVGRKFIPAFMRRVNGLLKDGGLGLLHTIGRDKASSGDPWTWKYIFPGYYIPALDEIVREMGAAGFSVCDVENLRLHYARTLDLWAENFERNADEVRRMFDDRFVRMWRLYLRGSSASFKYGELRVFQVLFSKGLSGDLPTTRDYVYS
ncbi:MAG: cyclopropane-fatty-acyl-phospholipid synthase family protein [Syntrophobacteraceae bacterium]|nr:cyclopropane-fatty-acyl-phospholipid synthase family protein [Desulfobacteraceae bacterium]